MSDSGRRADHRSCGVDVAAYALGALEDSEVDRFRRHLDSCVVCGDELAAFQVVVDALPLSAPQCPRPRALRRRVLAAIRNEPGVHRRDARRPPPRRPGPQLAINTSRAAIALGAMILALVLALGGLELDTGGSGAARVSVARVIGSTGTAELAVSGASAELIVHDLQPPPAGEIYEVWLIRPGRAATPTSALFGVTARGDGDVEVPGSLRGVDQVMVTPEAVGGSRAPTHAAVILAPLRGSARRTRGPRSR